MLGIGPQRLSWNQIRLISTSELDLTFWLRPSFVDADGRLRVIVPLRAFGSGLDAAVFEQAARRWHFEATSGDPMWWDESV